MATTERPRATRRLLVVTIVPSLAFASWIALPAVSTEEKRFVLWREVATDPPAPPDFLRTVHSELVLCQSLAPNSIGRAFGTGVRGEECWYARTGLLASRSRATADGGSIGAAWDDQGTLVSFRRRSGVEVEELDPDHPPPDWPLPPPERTMRPTAPWIRRGVAVEEWWGKSIGSLRKTSFLGPPERSEEPPPPPKRRASL